MPSDFTVGFEYVCTYLCLSPDCLEPGPDYFHDPVSLPLSSAHPLSICSGCYITSCLWPHLSSTDLPIIAAKYTYSPKGCSGSEGIIDFDMCQFFSKLSLESALNVWLA